MAGTWQCQWCGEPNEDVAEWCADCGKHRDDAPDPDPASTKGDMGCHRRREEPEDV